VDVVVTDMQMPGMDGTAFLAETKRRHPHVARVILSGQTDRDSIIAAIGPSQQFMAKPCDMNVLVGAVRRVISWRNMIQDDKLRGALGGADSLPKPPQVYHDLMALIANPECSIDDVVKVIESDVPTSAEVLRLVNSSFLSLSSAVDSVSQAVALLGLELVHGLVVASSVFKASSPPPGFDFESLSARGHAAGALCKRFAMFSRWPQEHVNDAYFAGLLCEVGAAALAGARPQGWRSLQGRVFEDPWDQHEAETAVFGVSSTQATAYLLGLWGFADHVVEMIAAQPVAQDEANAGTGAQLLTWARYVVMNPDGELPLDPCGYFTGDRLAAFARARNQTLSASGH
jgi:HD-like signal output (HDOD) protein